MLGLPLGLNTHGCRLPAKCNLCNGFGHAGYACSKKERKIWIPKDQVGPSKPMGKPEGKAFHSKVIGGTSRGNQAITPKSQASKQQNGTFDKAISRPKVSRSPKDFAAANPFDVLAGISDDVSEFLEIRQPPTFMEVFYTALGNGSKQKKDKGKAKVMVEGEKQERCVPIPNG